MLKFALTNRLVGGIIKKVVAKFLSRKLGEDAEVLINDLYLVESSGRVKLKIDAEVDMSSDAAMNFIDSL